MSITFRIPAVPVAQPRAKATTVGGHTRMYTPTTKKTSDGSRRSNGVAEFKAQIRLVAAQVYTGPPLTVPIRVDCLFVFPRHQGKFWKNKPMPRYPHTSRPDRDNLDKLVLDSLSGIVWLNDWLVFAGYVEKWHAAGDEQAFVEIRVTPMPGGLGVEKEPELWTPAEQRAEAAPEASASGGRSSRRRGQVR
jgi:Holliday junction resolvase RusA-like endonuclease